MNDKVVMKLVLSLRPVVSFELGRAAGSLPNIVNLLGGLTTDFEQRCRIPSSYLSASFPRTYEGRSSLRVYIIWDH
jgi:hypothetical protein